MLAHLKVLDCTAEFGAYAGRLLAALGAQVIRVEPPGGDPRRADPLSYAATHAGKTCVALDPASAEGRAGFATLLAASDILLDEAGIATRYGAAIGQLDLTHPALIAVSVVAHALGGTAAPATDMTVMALSGIMQIVGDPDRPPLKLPGAQAAALAGTQVAIAALLGVNARAATGHGQHIEVSAYQSAVLAGYRDPIVWEWTGRLGTRTGNRLVRGGSGVRQVWPCADGFVTWSLIDNPPMVRGMVALMREHDAGASLADVAWERTLVADTEQRQIEAWETELAAFFIRFPRAALAAWSAARGLGLSAITTPADALAEPHWSARNFWRNLAAGGTEITLPGPPFVTDAPLPTTLPSLALTSAAAFAP